MKKPLIKVAVSREAGASLEAMLGTLNKESLSKIKKQDFLSWLVINYEKRHFSKEKKKNPKRNSKSIKLRQILVKRARILKKSCNASRY